MSEPFDLPLASWYRGEMPSKLAVREPRPRARAFPYTERHLQCVWYDPSLRPVALMTHEGEAVEVEFPGEWNLEAGPDFLGAALRVGPGRRRIVGDVEVHIHARDWVAHHHHDDPRYRSVVAHVTYFPGTLPASELPPGAIQVALRPALAARCDFSFEAIDLAAYPYASRSPEPPCRVELRSWNPDQKQLVLEAAGQERFRQKAHRLACRIEEAGLDQTLYEETLAAFGYKHNKAPFRALAARVPLAELRERCGGDPLAAQAILMGVAGLLPEKISGGWDDETRRYVRQLWDIWFRHRDRWANDTDAKLAWRTAGIRPANHPVRRIAAAASLFGSRNQSWIQSLAQSEKDPDHAAEAASRWLKSASDPYWDRRMGWGRPPLMRPCALVGPDRIKLFVANVWVPLLLARGSTDVAKALLEGLEPEQDHQIIRQTAHYLFGPNHPRSWYSTACRRQGLIQVFQDFCLNDRSRCEACAFPSLLRVWREQVQSAQSRDG